MANFRGNISKYSVFRKNVSDGQRKAKKSLLRLTTSFTRAKASLIPSLLTEMVGSIELQSTRIRYILSKHQNELQSFIVKMMEGLPQKLKKTQSDALTTVLRCKFVRSKSNLLKFLC